MKEFVNKLIGRLEDGIFSMDERMKYDIKTQKHLISQNQGIRYAINSINELAEEYINTSTDTSSDTSSGYCEWKWGIDYAQVQCMGDKILFGSRRLFTYCPYCGKKIKVVE